MGNYKQSYMNFTDREKEMIREIVNYDFSGKLGYKFLDLCLKKEYPKYSFDVDPNTNNGEYTLCLDMGVDEFNNYHKDFYGFIESIKLLNKLENAGLLLIVNTAHTSLKRGIIGNIRKVTNPTTFTFDNKSLPICDFANGLIFVSPELKEMVKYHFLDINKIALIVGIATLMVGIATLIATIV